MYLHHQGRPDSLRAIYKSAYDLRPMQPSIFTRSEIAFSLQSRLPDVFFKIKCLIEIMMGKICTRPNSPFLVLPRDFQDLDLDPFTATSKLHHHHYHHQMSPPDIITPCHHRHHHQQHHWCQHPHYWPWREKTCLRGLRTTQAQTSLRISAVWSAPLLFAFWKVLYVNLLQMKYKFSS